MREQLPHVVVGVGLIAILLLAGFVWRMAYYSATSEVVASFVIGFLIALVMGAALTKW